MVLSHFLCRLLKILRFFLYSPKRWCNFYLANLHLLWLLNSSFRIIPWSNTSMCTSFTFRSSQKYIYSTQQIVTRAFWCLHKHVIASTFSDFNCKNYFHTSSIKLSKYMRLWSFTISKLIFRPVIKLKKKIRLIQEERIRWNRLLILFGVIKSHLSIIIHSYGLLFFTWHEQALGHGECTYNKIDQWPFIIPSIYTII